MGVVMEMAAQVKLRVRATQEEVLIAKGAGESGTCSLSCGAMAISCGLRRGDDGGWYGARGCTGHTRQKTVGGEPASQRRYGTMVRI